MEACCIAIMCQIGEFLLKTFWEILLSVSFLTGLQYFILFVRNIVENINKQSSSWSESLKRFSLGLAANRI